jgi:hypothetical protein
MNLSLLLCAAVSQVSPARRFSHTKVRDASLLLKYEQMHAWSGIKKVHFVCVWCLC